VTLVDIAADAAHARQMSVSLRHEAELVSGRRALLLDDRGWSASVGTYGPVAGTSGGVERADVPDIWASTSVEDIMDTSRVAVGPDEPFDGRTQEDEAAAHWAYLSEVLRQQGIVVDAAELSRLPHDVELSERLLARIGRAPG
jgi:hypothetical protein